MASRCARWISLLLVAIAGAAWAQPYPGKPVRILVGYAPGGSVDMVARLMAQKLTASFGQPVLVENRPGAASNIAGDITAKSPPDGYTLLISGGGALATNAAIYAKMPYDPLKDLGPIALLVYQGNVLILNPSVPSRSVKEFIALARSKPGQLNYGSGGNGSNQHLATELFTMMAGVKLVHVPYKGGAPAMSDLVGGQIEFMFQTIPEAIQHIKSGRVRALGVTGLKRSAVLPDVPTIDEAGLPGFAYEGFIGMVGPAGMPKELVAQLSGEVNKALATSDVHARLLELGLEIGGGTPEQFAVYLREQSAKAIKLAKDMGIKPVD
jgi:tripartite-type tricarboxylate transporter receptor subunit TctC